MSTYQRKDYKAGERTCYICGKPMPAFSCWPGRTYFYHDTPECRTEHHHRVAYMTVAANEKPCSHPGCTGFAPAGAYDRRTKHFFCSDECKKKSWFLTVRTTECAWCGKKVHRPKRPDIINSFCCPQHNHLFRSEHIIRERAGIYLPLLEEYIELYVVTHYRSPYGARNALSYFFQFLREKGIEKIELVTPRIISAFIAWEHHRDVSNPNHYVSYVRTFFDWMIAEDRFTHANPVIPKIHHGKTIHRLARPYSKQEMATIWAFLDERGNNRVRLGIALGEETGLRHGEILNLRVQDVDLEKQTVFVRTPNKTMRERTAFFHDKTRKCLAAWMAERDPNCGHDYLLHNSRGDRCLPTAFHLECRRVLCVWERKGKVKANDTGLETFSFHRLRHTMASRMANGGAGAAAIMSQGGWVTAAAMCGYTYIEPANRARAYNEGMERVRNQVDTPRQRTTTFRVHRGRKAA